MTTYATLTWESTPALWRAYTDPEGEQGFGKTKEEALDELIEQICEGMRESAKDAKLAELTRSLADSTQKAEKMKYALIQAGTLIQRIEHGNGKVQFFEAHATMGMINEALK